MQYLKYYYKTMVWCVVDYSLLTHSKQARHNIWGQDPIRIRNFEPLSRRQLLFNNKLYCHFIITF